MHKQTLELKGCAYRQGNTVEVYLKLPSGKFVKCVGSAKEAKRTFGRETRAPSELGR